MRNFWQNSCFSGGVYAPIASQPMDLNWVMLNVDLYNIIKQ